MIISSINLKKSLRVMKSTIIICSSFFFSTISSAQSQTAIVGQATQLKFNISNVVNSKKCHIEVTLPDQTKTSVEVDGPQFLAVVDFIPQKIGNVVIQWEGKNKIRGVNSVFACPGSGVVQLQVNGNAEQLAQKWNQYFSQINDEVKDCLKYGMDLSQFKYQVVADPNTVLTSPDDQKLKPIYEKCESFAKQKHPGKAYSCVLPLENNARSTCDAVYAEKQSDGKLKTITRADAIQLHFDGKPWVIGQNENPDARISRLKQNEENKLKQAAEQAAKSKQDEENKLKQAAEQAAKLEAEEKDRKFKESPEYKKQQAELERKRIAEEKEAAKSAAEAERKRITEEKQAEKIAAELERKRVADEKVATARQEKERKENEIKDKKWQEEQDARSKRYIRELAEKKKNEAERVQQTNQSFVKEHPFYAHIECPGFQLTGCIDTLKVINGGISKNYGINELMLIAGSGDGIIGVDREFYFAFIHLKGNFTIVAQNSTDHPSLRVRVFNKTASGEMNETFFDKTTSRKYEVIRVSK